MRCRAIARSALRSNDRRPRQSARRGPGPDPSRRGQPRAPPSRRAADFPVRSRCRRRAFLEQRDTARRHSGRRAHKPHLSLRVRFTSSQDDDGMRVFDRFARRLQLREHRPVRASGSVSVDRNDIDIVRVPEEHRAEPRAATLASEREPADDLTAIQVDGHERNRRLARRLCWQSCVCGVCGVCSD